MRGISARVRWLFAVLAILAMGGAGVLYWTSVQTETAYMFSRDLPQYEFIQDSTDSYLTAVSVPKQRNFEAITDPRVIVGMYTGQLVTQGQLVHESMLIAELPSGQRQFERGLLPVGTRAYPVDIPNIIAGLFKVDDLLDIYLLWDRDGQPTADDRIVMLFQKVTFLGEVNNGTESSFLIALTPEQIAAYEGWKRVEGVSFTGAITQSANGDYQPLHELLVYPDYNNPDNRDLFAPPTPTPEVLGAQNGASQGPGAATEAGRGDVVDVEEEE